MNQKNLPIVIGIAIPIIFIIVISIFINQPSSKINPQHNFIYTYENRDGYSYSYKNTYELIDGKIVAKAVPEPKNTNYYAPVMKDYPVLYLYDVKTDTTKEVKLKDLSDTELVPGPSSPDGYNVGYKYNSYGLFDEIFVGSSRSSNGYYISKDNAQKKVNLSGVEDYYSGNFRIIGWLK